MTLKIEITRKVAEILGLSTDSKSIKQLVHLWWGNPRNKSQGGLRLTEQGFECLKQADIKTHRVKLEHRITSYNNQLIIWLDQYIDCPWFLNRNGSKNKTNLDIYVFSDKMAVQLILFDGDVERFLSAKVESIRSC
jgi:hypothetical protein